MTKYFYYLTVLFFGQLTLADTCPNLSGNYTCVENVKYEYDITIQQSELKKDVFSYFVFGYQFFTDNIKRPEATGDGATLYISANCTNNNFNTYFFYDYSQAESPFTGDYISEFIKTTDGLEIKETIQVYNDKNLPAEVKWISCVKKNHKPENQ